MFENSNNTALHTLSKDTVLKSLRAANDQLLPKTDLLQVEQMLIHQVLWNNYLHFDLSYTPWSHLGYKICVAAAMSHLAENSPIAAISIFISCSSRYSLEALETFMRGVYAFGEQHQIPCVLQDINTTKEGIYISASAYGKTVEIAKKEELKVGDLIVVTGDLGAAYMGLLLLEREKKIFNENPDLQPDLEQKNYIVGRHLKPNLPMDAWAVLKDLDIIPKMVYTVTNGLAKTLIAMDEELEFSPLIYENKLPIDPETQSQCMTFAIDTTTAALHGGEDYELCFIIDQDDYQAIKQHLDFSIIGYLSDSVGTPHIITNSGKSQAIKDFN